MSQVWIVTDDRNHKAVVVADDSNEAVELVAREYVSDNKAEEFERRSAAITPMGHTTVMGNQVVLAATLGEDAEDNGE